MELLYAPYFNTTTMAAVESNTTSVSNMLQWNSVLQYVSDGYNNDATTTTVTIAFDQTTTIDRIALVNHNLKDFLIYYNGASASVFSFTAATADTGTSDYSSNSETSQFWACTSVDCTSVSFDLSSTQATDAEKAIGVLFLGQSRLEMERIPSAKNYKPVFTPKQINHKMSDGSVRLQNISEMRSAKIKYKYISTAFRNNLKTIHASSDTLTFVAFGTTTGWDEFMYPCVWPGKFDFFKFSDNASESGHTGQIILNEVIL